jgi:serine phosphatase RsbU (regulator of sigma subunit)
VDLNLVRAVGATRPLPGEADNGDAWLALRQDNLYRVAVIDGLGHGPGAAAASEQAVRSLEATLALSPAEAIRRCHTSLGGTRGAVMGVADFDLQSGTLSYAAVGNTDAILWQAGQAQRLISYRGIVGSVLPRVRSVELPLAGSWRLLMHTDGVMERFDPLAELPAAGGSDDWADDFLQRWARPTDDATVVLVTGA